MDTVNYKKYLFILLLCLLLFVLEEVTYNQLQLPVHLLLPRAGVPHHTLEQPTQQAEQQTNLTLHVT